MTLDVIPLLSHIMHSMAKATLVLHRKRYFDDGCIAEIKLWLLPRPVQASQHLFKYSLFYGRDGERVVAYDNERGKGDHRHYADREEAYTFTTPEQLLADFLSDVDDTRRRMTQ